MDKQPQGLAQKTLQALAQKGKAQHGSDPEMDENGGVDSGEQDDHKEHLLSAFEDKDIDALADLLQELLECNDEPAAEEE